MKFKYLLLALLLSFFLGGCATILSGDSQKIDVKTSSGKKVPVKVNGQQYEVPSIIEIKREKEDKLIRVEDKKCQEQQVLLPKKINPVFFVNILSGGVFGSTTDYASGSMWEYDDKVIINCE